MARWRIRPVRCRDCGEETGQVFLYPMALLLPFAKNKEGVCEENFGCKKKCLCIHSELSYIVTEYRNIGTGFPPACYHLYKCATCNGTAERRDPLFDGTKPIGSLQFMVTRSDSLKKVSLSK